MRKHSIRRSDVFREFSKRQVFQIGKVGMASISSQSRRSVPFCLRVYIMNIFK
jgi:hypothetical protein